MRRPLLQAAAKACRPPTRTQFRRQHAAPQSNYHESLGAIKISPAPANYAFCFDIDGVLLRSASPIPGATEALKTLQANRIPFLLLTNGGGKRETERVKDLSERLAVPLDTSLFVQSHTPFSELGDREQLKKKCVLVVGGDGPKCRAVAQEYGFENVVTPGDIYAAHPEIWPFSRNFSDYYSSFAQPLPRPINPASPKDSLKIDAVFVYNDPRDWGLDIQLILDVLLSRQGILGTHSSKLGRPELPNHGYLQDSQPQLYFSNPDILWAANYGLPRLGQGAFRAALQGAWRAVTSLASPTKPIDLHDIVIGKPHQPTYEFAERQLMKHHKALHGENAPALRTVYMVGDNPESDICGANTYVSNEGVNWVSVLTRTGVYDGNEQSLTAQPSRMPRHIVHSVAQAVALGINEQQRKF